MQLEPLRTKNVTGITHFASVTRTGKNAAITSWYFFFCIKYTWMTFYSPRWGMKFICFYVIDDSDSILFSIIRRELFCKILNISSSSYKVMKSSMMCGFCMKKRASTVKLMCLISIIYLTFIQFLVKINAISICNLKFSFHLTSRQTLYIVHG